MPIISSPIPIADLKNMAAERFGDMVKAVVDVNKRVMALGAELHADAEAELLESGSEQNNLWGINIYVNQPRTTWIEFDSMINIKPSQGNRSRAVESEDVRKTIAEIVNQFIR